MSRIIEINIEANDGGGNYTKRTIYINGGDIEALCHRIESIKLGMRVDKEDYNKQLLRDNN